MIVLESDPSHRYLEFVLFLEHVVVSNHRAESKVELIKEYFKLRSDVVISVLLLFHRILKLPCADKEFTSEVSNIFPVVNAIILPDYELVAWLGHKILEKIDTYKSIQIDRTSLREHRGILLFGYIYPALANELLMEFSLPIDISVFLIIFEVYFVHEENSVE